MKTTTTLILSFFILASSPVAFASTSEETVAKKLCDLIVAQPVFDYDSVFSPSLSPLYPKSQIVAGLQRYFSVYGTCESVIRSGQSSEVTTFTMKFADGTGADLFLGLNAEGLVDKFLWGGALPPADTVEMREVMVSMRDGSKLRTLIFQKNDGKKKPVLLERTPYLYMGYGATPAAALFSGLAQHFVNDDYAYVLQAIRGTGGSEGEFKFSSPQEIEDGYDSVTWAAKQNFSTGRVGALGGSYDGFTAMALAASNAPALKVVVAGSYFTNMRNYGGNYGGVLTLFNLRWLNYAVRGRGTPFDLFSPLSEPLQQVLNAVPDIRQYDHLFYGVTIPEWQRIATNYSDTRSPFWKERSILEMLPEIKIPTYHLAGLNGDGDAQDTLQAFEYLQHRGLIRTNGFHRLIVGYWPHPAVPQGVPFLQERADRWFAHYLKGKPLAYEPPVQFAAEPDANTTHFYSGTEYPIPQWKEKVAFLSSGVLQEVPPSPTFEGTYTMDAQSDNTALLSSSPILPQDTTLSFFKEISEPMTAVGTLRLKIHVSIDTPQTDVIAMIRKWDKRGQIKELAVWGSKVFWSVVPIPLELQMGPLLEYFSPNERLEVVLTSNLFPITIRNTNSVLGAGYFNAFSPARVTLISSEEFPSSLTYSMDPKSPPPSEPTP